MDISTASPVEIDTELARLGTELSEQVRIMALVKRWIESRQDGPMAAYYADSIHEQVRASEAAAQASNAIRAQMAPLQDEYDRRGGWTRYYLVDAHNGHVHHDISNRRCSRTPSTTHMWLTTESGRPRADVIADAGERCCTMCFPEAPVDVLKRPSRYRTTTEIDKEARAVERAVAKAKRAAKAITNPDGTPLRINLGGYWETIGTVIAAQRKLVDIVFDAKYQGRSTNDREVSACQVILAALAAKTGHDVETLKNEATARLIKKCKREGITY